MTSFSLEDTSLSFVTSAVSLGLDIGGILVLSIFWFPGSGWLVAFSVVSCFDVGFFVVLPVVLFSVVGSSVVIS